MSGRADRRRRRRRRRVWRAVSAAALVALLLLTWPTTLGGHASFVVVRGRSMEPTYHTGDVVYASTWGGVAVGDLVVVQIPHGQPGAGQRVIHRIVGLGPRDVVITKGDNNRDPDAFVLTRRDVLGRCRLDLGRWLLELWSRWAWLLAAAAAAAVVLLLWPDPPPVRTASASR